MIDPINMANEPTTLSSQTIVLEDVGDCVRLVIGKEKQAVKVSRAVLMVLSPVLRAMVSGPYREGSSDNREIKLPEDDPKALLLVLRIGHFKTKALPKDISFQELYQLAIVCDKYDTVSVVRPYFDKWAEVYTALVEEPGYEEWMLIAWTFGMKDVYLKITNCLLLNLSLENSSLNRGERALADILHVGAEGKSVLNFKWRREHPITVCRFPKIFA